MNSFVKLNFIYRVFSVIIALGGLLLIPLISIAQGGTSLVIFINKTGAAPQLGAWVTIVAMVVVAFTVIHFHHKQKSLVPIAKGI